METITEQQGKSLKFALKWGSGSQNTYRKNREIPKFNSIEYQKCSIPKFQYYWIPKVFNTEISILLNTKKISILKFNSTKILGISPDIPKNTRYTKKYLNVLHFQQKKPNNFVFPKISEIFSVFVWYSLVFSVLITKIPNFGMKTEYWKKNQKFFWIFLQKM